MFNPISFYLTVCERRPVHYCLTQCCDVEVSSCTGRPAFYFANNEYEANKLSNNALIKLTQGINQEERGILIFLIDSRAEIKKLVSRQRTLTDYFNIKIDVIAMSEAALVDYGMKYANNLGYSIDEGFANMAFHKRVREAQAGNHTVTIAEVKQIVDEAIDNNKGRRVSNLFRKMSKNLSDENGMIMLREKDFE